MIRIDEIYYNTFLPSLQQKPLHGMHWFDPFGSVNFKDLCSVPAIPWNDQSVRYLFWDQEPLQKETVDQTLAQFKKMYNGIHHLITSEQDSTMVEYVCDTYGFISHHYFFHGWAALDWYRGYNRSFLMASPTDRVITKTFIAPNRIVAGQRQHRLLMLYHIFKNSLSNNWISCPDICPAEGISVLDAVKSLTKIYPDIESVFAEYVLPINFPNESSHPMHSCWLSLFRESSESLLYLVTETVATGKRLHLTEKTFKPICLQMPFIIVGTHGSLKYLRSYGFQTFGDFWDESYDDEVDDIKRIEKIAGLLQNLNAMTNKQKQKLFDSVIKITNYNYNHFYNGNFEQILWQELTAMQFELFK